MGIYDRDYSRSSPRNSVGGMALWSINTWLIVINVAVFVLEGITTPRPYRDAYGYIHLPIDLVRTWGSFSMDTALGHWELWRFITFQFLHASPSHIFFNMLALYFFGPMVESYLGRNRYLVFYLSCGIAGALSFVLLSVSHVLPLAPGADMVGASAGIFGVLIAGARLAPDATVMLLFPPIPMKLKVMAWIMIGIAAYTVLFSGNNAGGEAAHLGGAAWGYLLIRNHQWLNWPFRKRPPSRFWTP